jgi:hypothetical protein
MTDYRDRLIDLALREELGGEKPPDLMPEILRRDRERRQAGRLTLVRSDDDAQPGRRLLAGGRGWGLGLVAAILVLAGTLGLLLRGSGNDPDSSEPVLTASTITSWPAPLLDSPDPMSRDQVSPAVLERRGGLLVPSTSVVARRNDRTELGGGWIYATRNVSSIRAAGADIDLDQAQAIIKLGDVPSVYEAARMADLLRHENGPQDEKELDMLFEKSKWTVGAGVVLCLFTGRAVLAGETIKAPEKITADAVFATFDTSGNGILETAECICPCTAGSDFDGDGKVTLAEFKKGVVSYVGSEDKLVAMVEKAGGVKAFHDMVVEKVKTGELTLPKSAEVEAECKELARITMDVVYARYDRNENGTLEADEQVCQGARMADFDRNGKVTQAEFEKLVTQYFGSVDKFVKIVRSYGSVDAFYESVSRGEKPCEQKGCDENGEITLSSVFAVYDKNADGCLVDAERCCEGTRKADFDEDGKVTPAEFERIVRAHFGSTKRFLDVVKAQGGPRGFYDYAVKASSEKTEKAHD